MLFSSATQKATIGKSISKREEEEERASRCAYVCVWKRQVNLPLASRFGWSERAARWGVCDQIFSEKGIKLTQQCQQGAKQRGKGTRHTTKWSGETHLKDGAAVCVNNGNLAATAKDSVLSISCGKAGAQGAGSFQLLCQNTALLAI